MASITDKYIGKRYGHWTVLSIDVDNKDVFHNYVVAKCDCGNENIVPLEALIKGESTSCGHLRAERRKKTKKNGLNYLGQTVGDYFVVRKLPERDGVPQEYIGICENGHEILLDNRKIAQRNRINLVCWCHEENLLKKHRMRLGYTLEDVAFIANISQSSVNVAERFPKRSSRFNVSAIASALALSEKETQDYLDEYIPRFY